MTFIQKINILVFTLTISLSSLPFSSYGQDNEDGLITYLEKDGKEVNELTTVVIYPPKGDPIEIVTKNKTRIKKGSTIMVPRNTVVGFQNKNGETILHGSAIN